MATVAVRNAPAGSSTNASTYASGSFTPTAGELLVVGALVTDSLISAGAVGKCTASANGLTFTRVGHVPGQGGTGQLMWFVANQPVPASPVAMTVTVDMTGDTGSGCGMVVLGVGGMGAGRFGMQAVKSITFDDQAGAQNTGQQDSNTGSSGAAPTFTLPASSTSGNVLLGMVHNLTSPAGLTPPSGWTEANDVGYSTPTTGFEAAYLASAGAATTHTWGSNSASNWATFGIELNVSDVPSSGKNVALVVADKSAALSVTDAQIKAALEAWGHAITLVSDEDSVSAGKDLHYITESISGGTLGTKYQNLSTPVISHDVGSWISTGQKWTTTAGTNAGSGTNGLDLLGHASTSGLPDPIVHTYASVGRYGGVIATDFGSGTPDGVATPNGIATSYSIFAFDVGDLLADGAVAAGRQAGIGMVDSSSMTLSWDGIMLLGSVAAWAMTAPPAAGFSGWGVPVA